jgi:tellurite resistance protein/predicted Zn-ribbon and HTH transcriptional regulator
VLVIGVIVVVKYVASSNMRTTRQAILNAQYAPAQAASRMVSLAPLQQRDPQLTEAAILDRVRNMSVILREAWCAGDMRAARSFVSDGIYSRFQVQLSLMRSEGLRNVMSDASILYTTIEAVSTNPPLDAVHVRFTAQARDRNVPINSTNEQIQQALRHASVEPYTEIWTLVRRHGAVTKLGAADVGKRCPACGAPLDGGEIIKCKYCNALVASGEHDWVLAEITQASEWYPESHERVDGLDQLRQDDPGVAREVLEDRASYLFWKWMEAARLRSPLPLRKCATPEFVANAANMHPVMGTQDVAVGAADAILCDPGPEGDRDLVYVKVYWSAKFQPGAAATPMQTVARLSRKAGVTSKLSMTSVVCQNCGAPLTDSDNSRCDRCNSELTAGDQAWVLDGMMPPGHVRSRGLNANVHVPEWMVPNIADPRERAVLFAQMAACMSADGHLGKAEKKLLRMCAQRWSLPEDMVVQVFASPSLAQAAPIAVSQPQYFLAGLVAAAMADGKVDAAERRMLERVCVALQIPPAEIDATIAACTARLQGRA